ncbi:hypothetical protein VE23_20740 [Paenibacillus sp. D9]|nr:hypothetical protein VE23_20740 [Paenibacillus sp. D9]
MLKTSFQCPYSPYGEKILQKNQKFWIIMLLKAELCCYTLSKIYQFHIFLNLVANGMVLYSPVFFVLVLQVYEIKRGWLMVW